MSQPPRAADALAGVIAADVARQLADPGRALRDRLGLVVDHLERHVATSTGPAPYPWRSLQTLRQDLAAAYLEATQLAHRLGELADALGAGGEAPGAGWVDAAAAVELGVQLSAHHLADAGAAAAGGPVELVVDLGEAPRARAERGRLALLVAQLVGACARSARARAGSALSVRLGAEPGHVVIAVADNGDGLAEAAALGELARELLAAWGGTADAASDPGRGCAFELRLIAEA